MTQGQKISGMWCFSSWYEVIGRCRSGSEKMMMKLIVRIFYCRCAPGRGNAGRSFFIRKGGSPITSKLKITSPPFSKLDKRTTPKWKDHNIPMVPHPFIIVRLRYLEHQSHPLHLSNHGELWASKVSILCQVRQWPASTIMCYWVR